MQMSTPITPIIREGQSDYNSMRTSPATVLITILVAAVIFVFDLIAPFGIAAEVPYVMLVASGIWYSKSTHVYWLALLSSGLTILGGIVPHDGPIGSTHLINRALELFVIWIVAYLIHNHKVVENERQRRTLELEFQKHAVDEHAIVSVSEVNGEISYVNEKFCMASGYSAQQLIGQKHTILHSGEHPDEFFQHLWDTIRAGKTWHGEIKNRNNRGYYYWVRTTIVPTLDERGEPVQFVSISADITEQKAASAALSENLKQIQFYKDALDEHAIVSVANVQGDITYVNEKFCEVSGYTSQELIGQNHSLLYSGEHAREFFVDLWRTIAHGRIWHGEIKNENKNGGYYWVRTTIVPNLNEQGKPFQYIGIRTEITESKLQVEKLQKATEEAEAANLAKSRFLAAMSHEIRTPMAGVIGVTDLLLDSDLSPQQLEWATSVRSSGQNLLGILNEVLDQSKLDAGMMGIDPTDFHLPSFIDETLSLYRSRIEEKQLEYDVEYAPDLPIGISADRMRIGQVLSNLMSNALKFTETGSIRLKVEHKALQGDLIQLRFSIIDTGIGLDMDVQEKLFAPFVQADNSTSRAYGGTGLGLSIVKQLSELMGGEAGVTSKLGEGSEFWFTVECRVAEHSTVPLDKRKSLDRWVSSRSLNVLVAEDNDVNQQLIAAILNKLNHTVVVAENGEIAVEKVVEGTQFDVVLMDVRMPIMDGIQATKTIRSMGGENSNVPIIALTADIAAGNIDDYLSAGVNEVCAKPIDLPVLLGAINAQLNEVIHTSLKSAVPLLAKKLDEEDTSEDVPYDNNLSTQSFDYVLARVSAILDQISELEQKDAVPALEIAGIGAEQLAQLQANYEESLLEQSQVLISVFQSLESDPTDKEIRKKARELTHTLKGGGKSFGYNLITIIAEVADEILKTESELTPDDMRVLENHTNAIVLVASKKITGNGGKAGRILLEGLKFEKPTSPETTS